MTFDGYPPAVTDLDAAIKAIRAGLQARSGTSSPGMASCPGPGWRGGIGQTATGTPVTTCSTWSLDHGTPSAMVTPSAPRILAMADADAPDAW